MKDLMQCYYLRKVEYHAVTNKEDSEDIELPGYVISWSDSVKKKSSQRSLCIMSSPM